MLSRLATENSQFLHLGTNILKGKLIPINIIAGSHNSTYGTIEAYRLGLDNADLALLARLIGIVGTLLQTDLSVLGKL
jgi:hypothetical protein